MATEKTVSPAAETTKKAASATLVGVGRKAVKKYGYAQVSVTSDGAVFKQLTDAKNHAANLKDREVVTVKKNGNE